MISASTIYWINVLDGLTVGFNFFAVVSFIFLFILCIAIFLCSLEDENKNLFKFINYGKKLLIVNLSLIIVASFTPSKKTLYEMYLIPPLVNNEKVQNITEKSLELIEKKIDDMIKDKK